MFPVREVLMMLTSLAWVVTYFAALRVGIRDKAPPYPALGLGFNVAYAIQLVGVAKTSTVAGALIYTGTYLFLDLALVALYYAYGNAPTTRFWDNRVSRLPTAWFAVRGALILTSGAAMLHGFNWVYGIESSFVYSAFVMNFAMSVMFIIMYAHRGSARGQSLVVAIGKFFGAGASTFVTGETHPMVLAIGSCTAIFDLIYIWLLATDYQRQAAQDTAISSLGRVSTRAAGASQ